MVSTVEVILRKRIIFAEPSGASVTRDNPLFQCLTVKKVRRKLRSIGSAVIAYAGNNGLTATNNHLQTPGDLYAYINTLKIVGKGVKAEHKPSKNRTGSL